MPGWNQNAAISFGFFLHLSGHHLGPWPTSLLSAREVRASKNINHDVDRSQILSSLQQIWWWDSKYSNHFWFRSHRNLLQLWQDLSGFSLPCPAGQSKNNIILVYHSPLYYDNITPSKRSWFNILYIIKERVAWCYQFKSVDLSDSAEIKLSLWPQTDTTLPAVLIC